MNCLKSSPLCSKYDSSHLKYSDEVAALIWSSLKLLHVPCCFLSPGDRLANLRKPQFLDKNPAENSISVQG